MNISPKCNINTTLSGRDIYKRDKVQLVWVHWCVKELNFVLSLSLAVGECALCHNCHLIHASLPFLSLNGCQTQIIVSPHWERWSDRRSAVPLLPPHWCWAPLMRVWCTRCPSLRPDGITTNYVPKITCMWCFVGLVGLVGTLLNTAPTDGPAACASHPLAHCEGIDRNITLCVRYARCSS